jgi:acetyl esterase/lipase
MEAQWLLLGLALVFTTLMVVALVSPSRLVRGNVAWCACAWFGSEFAPWLAAAAVLVATAALSGAHPLALQAEPGRLALLLLITSALGLLVVASRTRHAPGRLDAALREGLGPSYAGELPAERLAASGHDIPLRKYLNPLPRRSRSIELTADVPYPGGHARNVLDVYRPAGGCRDAPVLLQVHGGDWTTGHKRQQALPLIHHMASIGWIVVAVNYRLGPAARFPAPLIDCKSAMAWIRGHIASLGGDPSFIAVTGSGAGAHLASLLALAFDRQEWQPGFEHVDTRPAACVPLHGVYDLADRKRRYLNRRGRLAWLAANVMPHPLEQEGAGWDHACPAALTRPDAPPFFILHGTHDALAHVDEARDFAQSLQRVSHSPVAYAELPGAQHGWDLMCSPRALHTVCAVTRFLEWCAARHRALGSLRDSANSTRS